MDAVMDKKIKALLRLLSDPNEQVAATIQDQLVQCGQSVLPYLAEAERTGPNPQRHGPLRSEKRSTFWL